MNLVHVLDVTVHPPQRDLRVVILLSGGGSIAEALMQAAQAPEYPAQVVAVGSDRDADGLAHARRRRIPTFVHPLDSSQSRMQWDARLFELTAEHTPDLVVLAGFMKLVGPGFIQGHPHRVINTHPALCPAFPGVRGAADALEYGVKVTGATLFIVDEGTDTGPIIDQRSVRVADDDTLDALTERIKCEERDMMISNVAAMATRGWRIHGRKVTLP